MTQTRLNATFEGRDADSRLPLEDLQRMLQFTFGQVDSSEFESRVADLLKLDRQHRERLAAVWLDQAAQNLLSALDRETSIRWEDLPDRAECDWSEASRSAALLAGANLCEVSPTRIRLSDHGDRLLAELSLADHDQANPEVAS